MTIPHARILLALAIGILSGLAGFMIGMPLPWMLGPMIAVTAAALLHLPIAGPERLRPVVIPVIGVMLGSSITSDLLGQAADWITILAVLPVLLLVSAGISYVCYRRIGGYDPITAYYSSMPGGLNEMLIMGADAGGNERKIALAHAARVLMVILFVALFFGFFLGVQASGEAGPPWVPLLALTPLDYLILIACAVLGVPLAKKAHLPAAAVFGPMILSGAAHVAGIVTVGPPSLVIICAQIVIGTVIGSRFIDAPLRDVGRDLMIAVIATPLMLVTALAFAYGITLVSDMPLTQTFLAYAPGGLTEMSLLTLAVGQDVAFVSVTHIIRITLVIALAPVAFRGVYRYLRP